MTGRSETDHEGVVASCGIDGTGTAAVTRTTEQTRSVTLAGLAFRSCSEADNAVL